MSHFVERDRERKSDTELSKGQQNTEWHKVESPACTVTT